MENLLLWTELVAIPLTFAVSTSFIKAPYGKFSRTGFGILLPGKLAFCCYELVSLLCFHITLYYSAAKLEPILILLVTLYSIHYVNRSLIYTYFISHSMKPQSLMVALGAASFNLLNGFNQARGVLTVKRIDGMSILGLMCFILGLGINIHSDSHLASLRAGPRTDHDYKIPTLGLFQFVTCANYSGEILEWFGWALMLGSTSSAGWAFWMSTMANLVPRAFYTHKWYLEKFEDYPKNRRVLMPFII